mgnify:CR=1 FL=1
MDYIEFTKNINSQFFPVVLIMGEDAYLRDSALKKLTLSLNISLPDLNISTFDKEDVSVTDIVALANSYPSFSAKRLIVIKDFSVNKADKRGLIKLEEYLACPNPSTCLVFFYSQAQSVINNVNVCTVDCFKLNQQRLTEWITKAVDNAQKSIDKNAVKTIIEYTNGDMYKISQAVEKLVLYADTLISIEDVKLLVAKDIDYVIFDLTNALANGDNFKSMEICNSLLTEEEPTMIIASVYRSFRRMFFAHISKAEESKLSQALSVKPYAITKAKQQAKKFGAKKLKKALEICFLAEDTLKKFNTNEKFCVKDMVLKLCNL